MLMTRLPHRRPSGWALVLASMALLYGSLASARQPRRIRKGIGEGTSKFAKMAVGVTANVLELPPRARMAGEKLARGGAMLLTASKAGLKSASAFGRVREMRQAIENADWNKANDVLAFLEGDLRHKLSSGKGIFSVFFAALKMLLAERVLRHAAEDAVQRKGSTSMSALDLVNDELANPRQPSRHRTYSLEDLKHTAQERAAPVIRMQGALALYAKVVQQRRAGLRFDPWSKGAHGSTALSLLRRFHRASIRNGVRSIDGFKLPFGKRALSHAKFLSDQGYARMVEISDKLLDVLLMDIDRSYVAADAKTRAMRVKRVQHARVEEIVRLARDARDVMVALHIDTPEDAEKREKNNDYHPMQIGLQLADLGEMLLDRIRESERAGALRLTRSQRQRLRRARRMFAVARRREFHEGVAPAALAHNTMALLWRLKDQLKDNLKEARQELWHDIREYVLEAGGGGRAKIAHGRQMAQARLQAAVVTGP